MTYFIDRVVPSYMPIETAFGVFVTYYALTMAQHLLRNRVEVHYRNWSHQVDHPGPLKSEIDGIMCYEHPVPRPASLSFGAKVKKVLEESDSDLIHSHTRCALPISFLGMKKPHLVHLHGLPYYATERELGRKVYDYEAYLYLRTFLRHVDYVICYCNSLSKRVIELFGIPPSSVFTVYNGYDSRLLGRETYDLRSRFELDGRYVPLFVGRAEPIKGCIEFIRACRLTRRTLGDIAPVVIGSGWGDLLKSTGDDDWFIHIPHLNHIDLGGAYRDCDMHVAITKTFGYQKTTLEATACGTPVVATDNRDNRDICGEVGTYVNALDVEDISQGMLKAINAAPTKSELMKRSKRVRRYYSWRRSAEMLQDIYDRTCN